MESKKLIICLDFDGVIADTGELKRSIAAELTGKSVTINDVSGERVRAGESLLTEDEWELIREKVYFDPASIDRVLPVQGSIAAIRAWLAQGHKVKVVTARTGQMHADAERWLDKYGVSISVVGAGPRTTKVPHLVGCDIFVDDDADRAREATAVCKSYFFKWPYNDAPDGVESIVSLEQIVF